MYICLWIVLGYLPDLLCLPTETRCKGTSYFQLNNRLINFDTIQVFMFLCSSQFDFFKVVILVPAIHVINNEQLF